jgi:hypothetical protein
MPITPYHFGPSGFLGLVFRKWIDIPVFVLANVIVDVEVLVIVGLGLGWPIHRYCHTLLGAAVVGMLWGMAAYPLRHLFKKIMCVLRISYEPSFWKMAISGILGACLHVLIDGIYRFLSLWKITSYCIYIFTNRVYRNLISEEQVEIVCVAFFIASIIVYILARIAPVKSVTESKTGKEG